MHLFNILFTLGLLLVSADAGLLPLAISDLSTSNITLPSTGLSALSPIRPGLDSNSAMIIGWQIPFPPIFFYVRSFLPAPSAKIDYMDISHFLEAFEKAIDKVGSTPLEDGRFSLEAFGIYLQVTVNKESLAWHDLNYGVLDHLHLWLLNLIILRPVYVMYIDIMSTRPGTEGQSPIGRMALDNQPPIGWVERSSKG